MERGKKMRPVRPRLGGCRINMRLDMYVCISITFDYQVGISPDRKMNKYLSGYELCISEK